MKQLIITIILALVASCWAEARQTYNFNSDWHIDHARKAVTLPHAWNEDDAFRVSSYEMTQGVVWYRKEFSLDRLRLNARQHVFIEFEGAHIAAEVFVNGKRVGLHENGVMAFGFEITPYLKKGKNLIEVRTDNDMNYKEQATGTPLQWDSRAFFANYGGLTKNVWLHVTDDVYQTLPLMSNLGTTGVYVYGRDYSIPEHTATLCVESQVRNAAEKPVHRHIDVIVKERDGRVVCHFEGADVVIPAHGTATLEASHRQSGLHFWSWGYGYLYDVETRLVTPEGESGDCVVTTTGFRKTAFRNGMVYLNDRPIMVHGYAQRSTNEWPGMGAAVPPWLSDYSNRLLVESGGNVVRWMHVTPWKQDIESCDRVGLIEAMPAGDAEHDATGRQWVQRLELMRDAIVYNRNNPSILFYECGNQRITGQHIIEMKNLRNAYDPNGGRAIGCREMLDQPEAEYGGEMLYVNKSDTRPMWMMEYCRDEANRLYWNSWSYPYHQEGDGPLYRNAPANAYNHNNDEFVAELVRRWYDYYLERPGTGTKVNAGGVKIVFSDTQTHGRSNENYRVSGVVDAMRIKKDAYYAHQVMWDGWVDDLKPHTYIVGHWQYDDGFTVPTVYVVSNGDSVVLRQNGKDIQADSHDYRFLWTFKNVRHESDSLEAIAYQDGRRVSHDMKTTPGRPDHLRLTAISNPAGWKADGADVALVQVEVVDKQGRRCPLDDRLVSWKLKGAAEWRGGIAPNKPYGIAANTIALKAKDLNGDPKAKEDRAVVHLNHVLCDTLPVVCGVNRVMLRSLNEAGKVTLTATADGLPEASISLTTSPIEVENGLSTFRPSAHLACNLDRGETPSTPSFTPTKENVYIVDVEAGSNQQDATLSFDRYENTMWQSAANRDSAWITYTLAEPTKINEACLKMGGFRNTSYPIAIYAGDVEVWRGYTPKSLSYVRLPLKEAPATRTYTIRLVGDTNLGDAFGGVKELDNRNDEKQTKEHRTLKIIEAEWIRNKAQ
jgi:beta-galactosidase